MQNYIYQAGPVFTEAERMWHKNLTLQLERAGFSVIWPGTLFPAEAVDATGEAAPGFIFLGCKETLDHSGCVVALLDGAQVSDGTAWEIGYAYAKGLPIYGLRTDIRQSGDTKTNRINSMIEGCLTGFTDNIPDLIEMLSRNKSVSELAAEAGRRG